MSQTVISEHEQHAGSGVRAYLVIFIALAVFTLVSFVANLLERQGHITGVTNFAIVLIVAVCKAVLVAMFFMHLKFDWRRFYFVIIPALILGTLLIVVLLPDIVLAWHQARALTPPVPQP